MRIRKCGCFEKWKVYFKFEFFVGRFIVGVILGKIGIYVGWKLIIFLINYFVLVVCVFELVW